MKSFSGRLHLPFCAELESYYQIGIFTSVDDCVGLTCV